jgi:hypothetical protein
LIESHQAKENNTKTFKTAMKKTSWIFFFVWGFKFHWHEKSVHIKSSTLERQTFTRYPQQFFKLQKK